MKVLAIGVGGAAGANCRYWVGLVIAWWLGTRFPWATLGVNLAGAAALGFVASWASSGRATGWAAEGATLVLSVGFLGGFTTFSTLSLEAFRLMHHGQMGHGLAYLLASGAGGLAAVALGAGLAVWLGAGTGL